MPGDLLGAEPPDIFCWILAGRRSRSASLEVGGMRRSEANRSTSPRRSRRHSSRSRQGSCLRPPPLLTWPTPGEHAVFESVDERRGDLIRDGGQALRAGDAGSADQPLQGLGDLPRPVRARVDLGGVSEITKQMGGSKAGGSRRGRSRSSGSGRGRPPRRPCRGTRTRGKWPDRSPRK